MDDTEVLARMRADWNQRAAEDAYYYVAFGRRSQQTDEFFSSGADIVFHLERELPRLRCRDAALEIGCGPGRLMRPMSRHFTEIHGVNVSDEMIRLARERLTGVANAFPHHGSGSDLSIFPDARFDFVYSYAVFQHIPSREVVFHYLDEAWRVLKPGGVLRCQINGLPAHARQYDTWSGVRIAPDEIREMARARGWQLLGLEQIWTQYMWVTCRKPGDAPPAAGPGTCSIRNVGNAFSGEGVAPAAGAQAAISIWIGNLDPDADLNNLRITAGGRGCRPIYIGEPAADGVSQVTAWLPEGLRTGLVPVEAILRGEPAAAPAWVRIMPAPPAVPRIAALTDAINLMSGNRIVTRRVKVSLSDVNDAAGFDAAVDGRAALEIDSFCTDPVEGRWEFNFLLPEEIAAGRHQVELRLGRRKFAPVQIEVA